MLMSYFFCRLAYTLLIILGYVNSSMHAWSQINQWCGTSLRGLLRTPSRAACGLVLGLWEGGGTSISIHFEGTVQTLGTLDNNLR